MSRRVGRLAGNLALAVVSAAVCLAVFELAARLFVVRLAAKPATVGILSRYDPLLGWAQPAGESAWLHEEEFSTLLEVNSLGLRGPERPHAKPAGVRRVLLLGDSFTNGYTVAEELSVRTRLEQKLSLACGDWQVLNAGVAGYSTDQEYLYFLDEGRRYSPDVVVLMFFGNDLTGNARERKKPWFELVDGCLTRRNVPVPLEGRLALRPMPEQRWASAWRGSFALELLGRRTAAGHPVLHRRLAGLGLVRPLEEHAPTRDWLETYGPKTPRLARLWRRTLAILEALDAAVREAGARLVVFYVPARFELSEQDWELTRARWELAEPGFASDRVFRRLYQACAARSIPVIDPRAALARAWASRPSPYLVRDPHWNALGHEIAASEIAAELTAAVECAGWSD